MFEPFFLYYLDWLNRYTVRLKIILKDTHEFSLRFKFLMEIFQRNIPIKGKSE